MAEVVVSSADLTVLGGPSQITVDTNIGPAGNRGVFVLYGVFDPNTPRQYQPLLLHHKFCIFIF